MYHRLHASGSEGTIQSQVCLHKYLMQVPSMLDILFTKCCLFLKKVSGTCSHLHSTFIDTSSSIKPTPVAASLTALQQFNVHTNKKELCHFPLFSSFGFGGLKAIRFLDFFFLLDDCVKSLQLVTRSSRLCCDGSKQNNNI